MATFRRTASSVRRRSLSASARDATRIMDTTDLSRILSLVISVLTDPYDQFIERLRAQGRITEEEVQQLHVALKEQIPKLSELIKPHPTQYSDR
jgi:hypothetical protein